MLTFPIFQGSSKKQSESRKKRFRQAISDYIFDYVQATFRQQTPTSNTSSSSSDAISLSHVVSPEFDLESIPVPTPTSRPQTLKEVAAVEVKQGDFDQTLYDSSNDVVKILMKAEFYSNQIEHIEKFPAREAIFCDLRHPIRHNGLSHIIRDTLKIKQFYSHQAKGYYVLFCSFAWLLAEHCFCRN